MQYRLLISVLIFLALAFIPDWSNATSSKTKGKDADKSSKVDYLANVASRVPGETLKPPSIMKILPLKDGKFLLEPLSEPPKTISPSSSGSQRNGSGDISAISKALAHRPVRYARGGSLETGVATDCSGFTQFIFHHGFRIKLPRSSAEQAKVGRVVTRKMDFAKLLPGDLLLFSDGDRPIGHAGIYLGKGLMIHASSRRSRVIITDIRQGYYFDNFVVAKRFPKEPRPRPPVHPMPRLVDSNQNLPGPPPLLLSTSRIIPLVTAKMGMLLKLLYPWEYQVIKPSGPAA